MEEYPSNRSNILVPDTGQIPLYLILACHHRYRIISVNLSETKSFQRVIVFLLILLLCFEHRVSSKVLLSHADPQANAQIMAFFDSDKAKPASIYPTIALLNNFLINSHQFLNSFSENVEKKISTVSTKITQLEILLSIVEAKLNSIPDSAGSGSAPAHDESKVSDESKSSKPTSTIPPSAAVPPPPQIVAPPPMTTRDAIEEGGNVPVESSAPKALPEGKIEACNHPSYIPFLKMLKVGVPGPVVANKLQSAGLDPAVADNPMMLVNV